MELRQKEPDLSVEQIAERLNLSTSQVERHRKILVSEGLWSVILCAFVFSASAYYGLPQTIGDCVEHCIKSTLVENLEK